MKHAQRQDDELLAIMHILEEIASHDNYFLKGAFLYRLVDDLELVVVPNSRQRQVIRIIPFELMIGVKMKTSEQLEIKQCIADNLITTYISRRKERALQLDRSSNCQSPTLIESEKHQTSIPKEI